MKEGLNSAQKQAVESESPHLLVLAGPGTGKTRLIIAKILHLLDTGISPERLLAVTFSRKATYEMEERLLRERPALAGRVDISTLHSFCVDLVQAHGFRLGLGRRPELVSEAQAQLLFRRISPRLPFQHFVKSSSIDAVIQDLLSFFQDCKDEGLWPEQVLSFANTLPEETEDERSLKQEWIALGDIYNAFQTYCFDEGLVDFGDAVLGALRLLDDYPVVTKDVSNRYDYILVDEFQDTNWTQVQLLRKICGTHTKICVVGDDDQSIYRFRGASYSAFQFFEELFPEPEIVELTETYRLPPAVVQTATALIRQNGERRFRPNKQLLSLQKSSEPVFVLQANDFDEEAHWVADKIQSLIAEGVAPQEIGILIRAHSHADHLVDILQQKKIPFENSSSQKFFQQEIIQDSLAILKFLIRPDDNIAFLRLLDSSFCRMKAEEVFEFCRWARFGKISYFECLSKVDEAPLDETLKMRFQQIHSLVVNLFASTAKKRPSEILLQICEETEVIKFLLEENRQHELRQLADLLKKLSEWERLHRERSLQDLYPVIEAIAHHSLSLSEEEASPEESAAVRILSIHASKGLEFEHVFVLSLVGRRFPSSFRQNTWLLPNEVRKEKAPDKTGHTDEERRLLYVAMTRAKRHLYLCTVSKKGTKPSIFLTEDIEKNVEAAGILEKNCLPPLKLERKVATSFKTAFSRHTPSPGPLKRLNIRESLKLSFTQLEKYEKCPLSYWFAFELGIPSPANAALITGSCVHEALENFYKKVQQDRIPTADELVEDFEKIFQRNAEQHGVVTEHDLELGKAKLREYVEAQNGNFTKPIALEQEFNLKIGDHFLKGKIDRVDPCGSGVRIIDYKTGKSKSNEEAEDRKFAKESLQFSIYHLAAQECFKWDVQELCFYYVYDNSVLKTDRAAEDLLKTKERVLSLAEQIQNDQFEAKAGFHCRFCDYSKLCPSVFA